MGSSNQAARIKAAAHSLPQFKKAANANLKPKILLQMTKPRSIVRLDSITLTEGGQQLKFHSSAATSQHPDSGDSTLMLLGALDVTVKNPDLNRSFSPGQKFFLDFTAIETAQNPTQPSP